MAGDWFKMHRKIVHSAVGSSDWLCRLWVHLLARASWHQSWFLGESIEAGQVAFGQVRFAESLKVSRGKLLRGLKKLEALGQISLKANSRFTVVTICNWETYQNSDEADGTTDGTTDGTADGTTDGTASSTTNGTHSKNSKKVKNLKKEGVPSDFDFPPILDSEAFRTALNSWIKYRGCAYKPQGLSSLLTQARKRAEAYGVAAVINAMEVAQSNTWAGWNHDGSFKQSKIGPGQKHDATRKSTAGAHRGW